MEDEQQQQRANGERNHFREASKLLFTFLVVVIALVACFKFPSVAANCDHELACRTSDLKVASNISAGEALNHLSLLNQRNSFEQENDNKRLIGEPEQVKKKKNSTQYLQTDTKTASSQQQMSDKSNGRLLPSKRRLKRLAGYGRARSGQVRLAQRPRSTTTTTTSTSTTSTTTVASKEATSQDAGEIEEESNDSGDYEELETATKKLIAPKADTTTTTISTTSNVEERAREEEEELEGEEPGEEEVGEMEEESEQVSTSTTTQQTTTTRRTGGARKGTASRAKATSTTTTSTTTTTTSKPSLKEPQNSSSRKPNTKSRQKMAEERAKEDEEIALNSTKMISLQHERRKKKPLVALPFIKPKNTSYCQPEAYLEFPRDLIGEKWRSRGLIVIHLFVVCYMFYSLALVCERYFMPSLEEFAQRLQISEDVAGATLMSAGSSAPELFTAILGVFVAKGDVGTGAIVGSAVFNILFVIGICAFVSTTTAQLQWWPVLRDSVYYTFTVLVLILIIYDERITAFESAGMIALYGVYITIMIHNEQLKQFVTRSLQSNPVTAKLISSQSITVDGPDDVFALGSTSSNGFPAQTNIRDATVTTSITMMNKRVEADSIYLAGQLLIVRHKRLFRSALRFQSAARYIIVKRQHKVQQARELETIQKQQQASSNNKNEEVNYFGPENEPLNATTGTASKTAAQRAKMEAYARSSTLSKNKFSIVSKDDYEFWNRPPEEGENYYLWLAKIPVNFVLHYTIPDCTLYPDKYALTFVISIIWTAFFSYIMVWMVTIIGYTLGIPDSVMGVTFLAAGTSVPDCYSSIHAARNGMADMAVSNSIGSNVFDILIGLAVPWFIQSAIYPGVVATVNSRGVIYSVILLFLSLIVTIYLMNRCDWNLAPRLGLALIIAYAVFIVLTCMLEFNLFGHVNPPPCAPSPGSNY